MSKRKAVEDEAEEEHAGPSAYERERQFLIARNRARLEALGIPAAVTGLNEERAKAQSQQKQAQKPRKKAKAPPPGDVRKSSRLHGGDAQQDHVDDDATKFAMFLIDGECPKCGKVYSTGHRKHWDSCSGTGEHRRQREVRLNGADDEEEVDELTAEEIEAEERDRARRQKGKLQALELNGLIDFTDEHAKFVVMGSTGKHYTITLADEPSCQCMDFRRICKHIRLVLLELGIEDSPVAWRQAVEKNLLGGKPSEDDRLKVEEQPKAQNEAAGKAKPEATEHKLKVKPQTRAKRRKLPTSIASRA